MGLIREQQELNYKLTRYQEQKQQEQKTKAWAERLKKDSISILSANINVIIENNKDNTYIALLKQENIILQTITNLKELKINNIKAYDNIEEVELIDFLNNNYLKEYNKIIKKIELIRKGIEKQEKENIKKIILQDIELLKKDYKHPFFDIKIIKNDKYINELIKLIKDNEYIQDKKNIVLKSINEVIKEYKATEQPQQPEQEKELHWTWKGVLLLKSIKAYKKLFK